MNKTSVKKIFDFLKLRANLLLYSGNQVHCCLCDTGSRKFKTFGWRHKKSPKCIHCGSRARHRLIWKFLLERTPLFENHVKILHFAPEKPVYKNILRHELVEYYPCDLYPDKYDFILDQVNKVDITKIPFEDNLFDIILCNHVLEHVPDDKTAMKELFRVMKVGGFGIFQVPVDYSRDLTFEDFSITDPREREKAFGQFDHVRWYGRDYKQRLEDTGFRVDLNNYVNTFSAHDIRRNGFDPEELIYYCQKK